MSRFEPPTVLVLGGGGILGEAWMSALLAGLEAATGFDSRECDGYVGTSAGSIVAAMLIAGVEPGARLGELPEARPPGAAEGEAGPLARLLQLGMTASTGAAAPLAAIGLRAAAPGGAAMRRLALNRVPPGRRSLRGLGARLEERGARWDGRLSVAAVALKDGNRVMFGSPGAPPAPVGAAVEASCSIPGVFRPIEIGGRTYVDGGAWSPTNLDRAPAARGARVLCLNPTGSTRPRMGGALGALGPMSRSIAAVEALTLRRRGAQVSIVSPDAGSLAAIGPNLMDPGPRASVIEAGVAQGRALG